MTREQVDKSAGESFNWATPIVVALVTGVSLGFIDVLKNMTSLSWEFPTFWSVWSTLAIRITGAISLYISLWLLMELLRRWLLKLDAGRLILATAVFAGLMYELPFELKTFFLALAGAAGAYGLAKLAALNRHAQKASVRLFLTLPLVLGALMLTVWLHRYRLSGFFSGAGLLVNIGLIIFIVVTTVLFVKARRTGTLVLVVGVFGAATFFSSAGVSWAGPKSFGRTETPVNSDRQIKHVILIVIDTLRADALSCYGGKRIETPHIDKLAADGILFEQAFAPAPWTVPSVASIMTGLSPSVHLATGRASLVPETLPTLTEYMNQTGYLTGAFGYNPYLGRGNLARGFKEYCLFPKSHNTSLAAEFFEQFYYSPTIKYSNSTRKITAGANEWLTTNHPKEFFLWLHYFDPHTGYEPPEKYLPQKNPVVRIGASFNQGTAIRNGNFFPTPAERKWIRTLYDGEVRHVDANVGKVLDHIKQLGIYDESLIVLTSDHGEEFWGHDGFEHGHALYNEQLKVPLIIKLPGSAVKTRVAETVSIKQITPTILQLCRVDYDNQRLPTESLTGLWSASEADYQVKPVYGSSPLLYEDQESVIFDQIKYIRFLVTGREELYDLRKDPGERHNIIDSSAPQAQRARDIIQEHKKTSQKLRQHCNITEAYESKLDRRTLKILQSLGYIDK